MIRYPRSMISLDDIAPGLTTLALRTPTLPPATTTNTLIIGRQKLAVIEPATPEPAEQAILCSALAAKIDAGAQLVAIIITHHHVDHIAYAPGLRKRFGGRIMAHPATASRVPFEVDDELCDADTIDLGAGFSIEALHTPGHAPGHLVIHERSTNVAHVGDLVAGIGTILIDPEDDGDMRQYLDSLARIAGLRLRALVPAHGPSSSTPTKLLSRTIAHRQMREDKLLAALQAGPLRREELLARVYEDAPRALWPLADRSLEAHMQKLEAEQRLLRDDLLISAFADLSTPR
ncbi:MAG TPA: MBL fold metallo-hydrolase [Nannocystis exedens]|nr:MBL fold metallo-hydrolase [Nannocystis exedens]